MLQVRADLYKTTKGIVGSHGQGWYEVRSFVQQDMMRPRSAMFYIDTIDATSQQLGCLLEDQRCFKMFGIALLLILVLG